MNIHTNIQYGDYCTYLLLLNGNNLKREMVKVLFLLVRKPVLCVVEEESLEPMKWEMKL